MMDELVAHDGIGFALVRSGGGHALAIGPNGRHDLTDGSVTGVDPVAQFGPTHPTSCVTSTASTTSATWSSSAGSTRAPTRWPRSRS